MVEITNKIFCGNVLDILPTFPDDSIDCCVTSPPYWGLRNYGDGSNMVWGGDPNCKHEWGEKHHIDGKAEHGPHSILSPKVKVGQRFEATSTFCVKCGAWFGQLGIEPHPQMYIDHIVQIMEEVRRVLKPTGSLWLNVGDTYFGAKGKSASKWSENHLEERETLQTKRTNMNIDKPQDILKEDGGWFQRKQRMMIPERIAIAMQDRGWILRNTIIWYKPNHMPSSVTDRLTNSYEPVFFFVKNPRYFFDLDLIRRKHLWASKDKRSLMRRVEGKSGKITSGSYATNAVGYNPLGANPADVWPLCTEAFSGAHFATFPTRLVDRIIKAVCPQQVCKKCGKPRTRIVESKVVDEELEEEIADKDFGENKLGSGVHGRGLAGVSGGGTANSRPPAEIFAKTLNRTHVTTGWTDCGCNAGFEDGIILDPFMGSGTTALTARKNCRRYVGIEINPEFIPIIEGRLKQIPDKRLDLTLGLEVK